MSYKTGAPKSGTETRRTLLAQTARDMSRSCGGRRPSAEAKCSSSPIGSQIPAVPCPRAATLHTAVLIAAFRCDAPARCGAFVDERCIAAGDCDAVCIFPRSKVGTPGAAIVPHTLVVPSPRATRRAIPRRAVGIDERARPWSRRSPRVLRGLELELIATLQAGKLIATFHRAAPARYGAFADGRRVVMGDEGGRVYCKRARPWSRRAGYGGGCGRTRTLIQSSRIAKSSGAVGPRATTRRAIPDRALGTSERACLWLLQSYGAAFRYTVYCIELKCKNGGGLVAWRSQQPEPYR
jgi:hypothetical protein